ncbi:enoyl-CoA hydratase-related protein [Martelella sp. AMO21009]
MEDFVISEKSGHWGQITLNRPDSLNALNEQTLKQLKAALDDMEIDEGCRAIVITGAGRAFCAGQDLADCRPDDDGNTIDLAGLMDRLYNPAIRQIRAMAKPVIAAVNGVAAGGGANLALSCDIVVAKKSAKFLQPFSNIALIPDCGGTYFLPRLVGDARARGLAYLAKPITAEKAADWGLIWEAVDDDAFDAEIALLRDHLCALPTEALALSKSALAQSHKNTLDEQLDLERDLQGQAAKSAAHLEGLTAFFEKRPPDFLNLKA